MPTLSEFTTLRLGGPIGSLVDCTSASELVATVRRADRDCEPVLILGGGSNIVAADQGFGGVVTRVLTTGVDRIDSGDRVELTVQAGEAWDGFVEQCVRADLSGIECLSGIPGSVGATPIQNVGAYGQDMSETIAGVLVYDRLTGRQEWLSPAQCGFGYRTSVFKRVPERWVVLTVRFMLRLRATSQPIRYREVAQALGIATGDGAPLTEVRQAVMALRRAKGMVLDPADPDSVSAGSFFLNPIVSSAAFQALRDRVHERFGSDISPPEFRTSDGQIKSSAAWLIERAGFVRGYGRANGIAISGKHTLALTNRGSGTTRELVALADEITVRVHAEFGVSLHPEPVFVGNPRGEAPARMLRR